MDFHFWILLIAGFIIATLSTMLGIGGGILSVPLLYYSAKSDLPKEHLTLMSIHGSLFMAFLLSATASIQNSRSKSIQYSSAFTIIAGAALGAYTASQFATTIPAETLIYYFGIFLVLNACYSSIKLIRAQKEKGSAVIQQSETGSHRKKHSSILFLAGVGVGALSAFAGIGGGVVIVPLLIYGLRYTGQQAVASSSFIVLFVTLSSGIAYWLQSQSIDVQIPEPRLGFIYWPLVLPLALGGIVGALTGSTISHKIKSTYLKIILIFLQLSIALKLFLE